MIYAANRKLIYTVNQLSDWAWSHCHKPTPLDIGNDHKDK